MARVALVVLPAVVIGTLGFTTGQDYPNPGAEARVACNVLGAQAVELDGKWECLIGHRTHPVPR